MLLLNYPSFIFRTLTREGHDADKILEGTGLTAASFFDPERTTELPPIRQFILNAIEATGEPHLGIRLARQFQASFIGLPAYAAMNAPTLGDALAVLSRFFSLAFPMIELTYPDAQAVVRPGEIAVRLRPKLPFGDISYFISVSLSVGFEGLSRAILGSNDVVLRAQLPVARPAEWEQVEGQIDFPIEFEAPDIRVFLAHSRLAEALPGADPLNHPRLIALCEYLAERTRIEPTPTSQISNFLQEGQNLTLQISKVASALGYSERSLRRHLEQSGTTFRKLTNEIRERRARSVLATTSLPIQSIAQDLGFDSASNFSRSFKQWTGMSPTAFRQALSEGLSVVKDE